MSWQSFLSTILQFATSFGIKLLCAILLFIVGIKCITWSTKKIRTSPRFDKLDESLRSFLASFIRLPQLTPLVKGFFEEILFILHFFKKYLIFSYY